MAAFLQERKLPGNDNQARAIAAQSLQFDIIDGVRYFIDNKQEELALCHYLQPKIVLESAFRKHRASTVDWKNFAVKIILRLRPTAKI